MEVIPGCCVLAVATVFMFSIWRFSNWMWFVSSKKAKDLKDRSLDNGSHIFMFEDVKEMVHMTTESKTKPITLTHDIVPRVSPFFYRSITTYEFQVGDKVMLKVSSWKGFVRFENDGKFSPCFLGPFTVLERVGSQAYKLDLPPDMHDIHDTFDVSYLYKWMAKQQNVIPFSDVQIDDNMRHIEEPEAILDTKMKRLRNKQILLVKVQWRHHRGANVTWESKDGIQKRYPHLFA